MSKQTYKRGEMLEYQEEESISFDDFINRKKKKESSKVNHRQTKPIKKFNTK